MDGGIVGPGKPEQPDGDGDATNHDDRQTGLGGCEATVRGGDLGVAFVVEQVEHCGEEHADEHAQEGKTANALVPAAMLLVDDREGAKEHVERPVDDGHVDGKQQDDGLAEQQDPGPLEGGDKGLADGGAALVAVEAGDVHLAGQLGQSRGALSKEDRGVGFGDVERAEDPHGAREDGQEALDPAPALRVAEEASDDGAQDGAQERGNGKEAHGKAALVRAKHIRDDAAGVGQGGGTKGSGEEAHDDERPHVGGAGAASVKGRQGAVGGDEQVLAAKELAHGRPHQRADGEAQDEEGDAEDDDDLAGVELDHDLGGSAGVGGRDEGDGERRDGHGAGDGPFPQGRVELGVPGVVGDPVDDKGVVVGAGALVGEVDDVLGHDALVEHLAPVGDARGQRRLAGVLHGRYSECVCRR